MGEVIFVWGLILMLGGIMMTISHSNAFPGPVMALIGLGMLYFSAMSAPDHTFPNGSKPKHAPNRNRRPSKTKKNGRRKKKN